MQEYNKKNRKKINERQRIYDKLHKEEKKEYRKRDKVKTYYKNYKAKRRKAEVFDKKTQTFKKIFAHDKA